MTRPDVAVVGLGPAGRALAHRLLARGATVLAVDPHPERPWLPTYGGWAHQLPDWLPQRVVGSRSSRTVLVARGRYDLQGTYVVLDNAAVQRELRLDGAEVRTAWIPDAELPRLADVVVDCRGAARGHHGPKQAAHGVLLQPSAAERVLGDAEAILMDWRPSDGSADWGRRPPSFCYVTPLPDGRVLAEETCLAGDPPLPRSELASRLTARLALHGVEPRDWRGADVERVLIPMLPPPPVLPNRFGAAGDELNPITGYSVFASLARADGAARTLLGSGRLPVRGDPWRRAALRALLRLGPRGVVDLFDAFGRLPADAQRVILDAHAPARRLVGALARQWALMPPRGRGDLIVATAKGVRS
ncbi:MAG TPA: lycopene cyclase family protein [Propionibacteriaceae bacterium]|nr:lycopene cyclase family protein [Propionibacteriaceae bacterium]